VITRKIVTLAFVTLCSACIEPINIRTELKAGIVVVDGQVSSLPERSFITIGIASQNGRLPVPVSGAYVTLMEDNESAGIYEESSQPGKYLLQGKTAIPGREYHVVVVLPDERRFKSIPERLPSEAGAVSTYYEIGNDLLETADGEPITRSFIKVFADSKLPESVNPFLKWSVEEVFIIVPYAPINAPVTPPPCFVYQAVNPQSIFLLDRRNLNTSTIADVMVANRLVDYSFLHRHYFITYQSTISSEAYEYWTKVRILASQTGSIFDTPPATISGNVSGEGNDAQVAGYFQATNETFTRLHTDQYDFPFTLNFIDCINSAFQGPIPERCFECIKQPNSSYVRPPWFFD
jgi:hypothetical protein